MIKREIAGLPATKNIRNLLLYICYKNSRMNLLALLEFLGEERFVEFMEKFGGSYLRVPPLDKVSKSVDRYRLLLLFNKANKAFSKDKNLKEWGEAENQIKAVCERLHVRYETGALIAKKARTDLSAALTWFVSLLEETRQQNKKEE